MQVQGKGSKEKERRRSDNCSIECCRLLMRLRDLNIRLKFCVRFFRFTFKMKRNEMPKRHLTYNSTYWIMEAHIEINRLNEMSVAQQAIKFHSTFICSIGFDIFSHFKFTSKGKKACESKMVPFILMVRIEYSRKSHRNRYLATIFDRNRFILSSLSHTLYNTDICLIRTKINISLFFRNIPEHFLFMNTHTQR